jgi:hypothetical protein
LSRRLGVSSRVFRARLRKKCSGLPWSARIKSVCFPSTILCAAKGSSARRRNEARRVFHPISRGV